MVTLTVSRLNAHLVPGANFLDPDWPLGYTFRVIKQGTIRNCDKDTTIDLEIGQQGYIVSFDKAPDAKEFKYLRIQRYDPPQVAWITAESYVEISSTTKKGQTITMKTELRMPPAQSEPATDDAVNIGGALKAVFQEWVINKGAFDFFPSWVWERLGEDCANVDEIVNVAVRGLKRTGAAKVFEKSDFTLADLKQGCKKVTKDTQGILSGFYLRIYEELPDFPREVYIYGGSSNDFVHRSGQHLGAQNSAASKKTVATHYRIARVAKKMTMLQVVEHQDLREDIKLRFIIEEAMIALLNSYHQSVLKEHFKYYTNLEFDVDNQYASGFKARPDLVLELRATTMMRHAMVACQKSGWQSVIGRPSFAASGEIPLGMNRQLAINSSDREKVLWIKTTMPTEDCGRIINFQRTRPMQVAKGRVVFTINSEKTKDAFKIPIPAKDGTVVDVVFEIREDGKPHPRSLVRLPTVGPTEDWDRANSLALCATWKDADGNGRTRYFQRFKPLKWATHRKDKTIIPQWRGAVGGYVSGLALWRYFNQVPVNPSVRDIGDYSLGFVCSREAVFDCFTQTVTLSNVITDTATPAGPRRYLPSAIIVNKMMAAGLKNVGKVWSDKPITKENGFSESAVKWRKKCDYCWLSTMFAGNTVCKFEPGSKQCNSCSRLGRPCSWTPDCRITGGSTKEFKKGTPTFKATERSTRPFVSALMYQPLRDNVEETDLTGTQTFRLLSADTLEYTLLEEDVSDDDDDAELEGGSEEEFSDDEIKQESDSEEFDSDD